MRTGDDIRIERLLADIGARTRAHPEPDVAAVLGSVERRGQSRRRSARRRRVVSAAACVVVVLGAAAWWSAERPVRIDAADAPVVTPTTQRSGPDTGEATPPSDDLLLKGQIGPTLEVPGDGATVSVIGNSGGDVWIARADPLDASAPVPSSVTRLAPDGTLGPTTELHGVPLLATAAADRVWIVTEDRVVTRTDPARFRLKEVEARTGAVRSSRALPDGTPLGLWAEGDAPVVRLGDTELEIATDTFTMTPRAAPDAGGLPVPRVRSGASTWSPTTPGDLAGVVHVGADGTRSMLELPGAGTPVPAPHWGEGVAAVPVHLADRVDLLELLPPVAPAAPPVARTRLTGLPVDVELVAVGPDRVWLQLDGRIAALPLG
ncbi:MAG: hypothetical protein ACYC2O_13575 [Microthrixaceae bacterium]